MAFKDQLQPVKNMLLLWKERKFPCFQKIIRIWAEKLKGIKEKVIEDISRDWEVNHRFGMIFRPSLVIVDYKNEETADNKTEEKIC